MLTNDEMIRVVASMRTDLNEKRAALVAIASIAPGKAQTELDDAITGLAGVVKHLNIAIAELGGKS